MQATVADNLAERIRRLRVEAGFSQAEVADRVGLSRSAVTQIERGHRAVSVDELVRFASAFQRSPSLLLAALAGSDQTPSDDSLTVDELLLVLNAGDASIEPRAGLERLARICRLLTEIEEELEAHVYGPGVLAFRGAAPRTSWEATHQGYAAADDERRRLDLGSAPIRDMAETLATLRVRTSRLPLPGSVRGFFWHRRETGPVVVANQTASVEERRFQFAHGLAHVLFDGQHRWMLCGHEERAHHHEVRANAFASRFLMPASGVERFLQSIGRDTMGQNLGGTLEIPSDVARTGEGSRVRVSGRSRPGVWNLNPCELSQVAHYFGVTPSLAADVLRNLRLLSGDERDQLTTDAGRDHAAQARRFMRLAPTTSEHGCDAFESRLVALVAEGHRRRAIGLSRLQSVVHLLDLSEDEQKELFGVSLGDATESRSPVAQEHRCRGHWAG
jgi:transcriptional regulator with XRE-family HTH domain